MKFTSALFIALSAVATTTVSASPYHETNGERFARGLPPLPPQKRSGTPVYAAKRGSASSSPGSCYSHETALCCASTGNSSHSTLAWLLELLQIDVPAADVLIGQTCAEPSGKSCESSSPHSLCCNDNGHGGVIALGCRTCSFH
ncbi:hypothetical protein BT96DRAFT_918038 [Gymnopus androsaceus JB14]|uniref:Hydrophobin n=1 Tax=Gymnopus androsaceus JB14 TaxID=1447944 RepID=A0A6A4HZW9_9AGAR|nr:hypothetical protein BT96DRAFT_918038 [Gymnopus androsaceus JB14]